MKFVRPPVNEVGLSVSFSEPLVFHSYDVSATHDLFRSAYPVYQQVEPTMGTEFDLSIGLPPLNITPVSRWWFVSVDNANVLQLQENYVSRNWRRTVEIGEPPSYPGFSTLLNDFDDALKLLAQSAITGTSTFPEMRSCELMYDDILPGLERDGMFMLSEMLSFWSPQSSAQMGNWQCAWIEPIAVPGLPSAGTLHIQIHAAALPQGEGIPPRPIVRLIWKATFSQPAWQHLRAFFEAAHSHIGRRFREIISKPIQDSWGLE